MNEKLARLSEIAVRNMAKRKRDNGTMYWCRKDNAPDWLEELCRFAHGDIFADDWRYKFIAEALMQLMQYDGDRENACADLDSDVYNRDLLDWLGSNSNRPYYVDNDAVGEFGHSDGGIIGDIAAGQLQEKIEVFHLVADFLENLDEDEIEASA